jgi:hypothetical protein
MVLFQPQILPKFSISINGMGSYYLYRWEDRTFFFDFFPSLLFKEEVVLLSVYALSMRNDIEIVAV